MLFWWKKIMNYVLYISFLNVPGLKVINWVLFVVVPSGNIAICDQSQASGVPLVFNIIEARSFIFSIVNFLESFESRSTIMGNVSFNIATNVWNVSHKRKEVAKNLSENYIYTVTNALRPRRGKKKTFSSAFKLLTKIEKKLFTKIEKKLLTKSRKNYYCTLIVFFCNFFVKFKISFVLYVSN